MLVTNWSSRAYTLGTNRYVENYTLGFTPARRIIRGLQNRYPYPSLQINNYNQDPYPSFVTCLEREIGHSSVSYRLVVRGPVGRIVTDRPFLWVCPTIYKPVSQEAGWTDGNLVHTSIPCPHRWDLSIPTPQQTHLSGSIHPPCVTAWRFKSGDTLVLLDVIAPGYRALEIGHLIDEPHTVMALECAGGNLLLVRVQSLVGAWGSILREQRVRVDRRRERWSVGGIKPLRDEVNAGRLGQLNRPREPIAFGSDPENPGEFA